MLVANGIPAEDLDGILDMTDEELIAWMDNMGLDANDWLGGGQQWEF